MIERGALRIIHNEFWSFARASRACASFADGFAITSFLLALFCAAQELANCARFEL
jgi:hypothetical protein